MKTEHEMRLLGILLIWSIAVILLALGGPAVALYGLLGFLTLGVLTS